MKTSRSLILATVVLLGAVVICHAQDKAGLKSPLTQQEQENWRKTLHADDYAGIAKTYADYMIEHGRDVYGKVHSPLFMTVLSRQTGKPFKAPYPHVIAKPYAPGLRRDHKMRPYDRTYIGSNPLEDLPLYGLLYRLSELTGDPRYRKEADKSIGWFLENGWSPKTGLPGWGSHMYYQVEKDVAVFAGGNPNGGYGGHEYNFVWPYWDQHPEGPWEKYPHNPVFKPTGNEKDFDGIFLQHPCPVKVGDQWRLYYNGWTLNPEAKNAIGAEYAIGLAFAKDSIAAESGKNTTYYVDAVRGDNKNLGTSAHTAWKTLTPVNAMTLAPGDKVLLKADCVFVGSLHPKGSGVKGMPIVINRYGPGADPILAGEGKVENTICLHNQQHWEIRNLTVTNTDGGAWDDEGRVIRRAVYISAEDAGDVHHIHLNKLEIRDVRGMYRCAGNSSNGGLICQVLGDGKPTRFVDLRIEDCVFRTNSIDRYPVVVTSSWKQAPACKVVWTNNTLDHAGRAHIVIPADQWPRKLVYYFDPEVRKVFPLEKTAPPVSPFSGRVGCEDIFSEMAARLKRSWHFFEATRAAPGSWQFKHSPPDKGASLWATSSMTLAYYGELRALGFEPPWIENEDQVMDTWISGINTYLDPKTNLLSGPAYGAPREDPAYISHSYDWNSRNRVFTADHYSLPPGGLHGGDPLPSKAAAIKRFNAFNWNGNTYQVCNVLGKEMKSHAEVLRAQGLDPAKDEIIMLLHEMLDAKFVNGRWGKGGTADGNMKMAVTYCTYDWPLPDHRALIDFTLDGANGKFKGRGCTAFNQMWVLAEARRQFPDGYRGNEIDASLAQSFLTFLGNWNESLNFYSNNWSGKHNNGVPLFISHLLLDLPIMRGSAVYNWRQNPIIERDKNGMIRRNKVTYVTPGHPFYD